jgi:hypothetical protein
LQREEDVSYYCAQSIFLGAFRMRYVFATFVAILLVGCTVIPPSVRVASPVPVIAVEQDHDHGHGGHHCPPGQAKKGRC